MRTSLNGDKLRRARDLSGLFALERLRGTGKVVIHPLQPDCPYCGISFAFLQQHWLAGIPTDGIPAPFVHRCRCNSARIIHCSFLSSLQAPNCTCGSRVTLEESRPANGLSCDMCDGPSQLCVARRWACPGTGLCWDCRYERIPHRIVRIIATVGRLNSGTVFEVSAAYALSGELLPGSLDVIPPYTNEMVQFARNWLDYVVCLVRETDGDDDRRLCSDGFTRNYQELLAHLGQFGAQHEWPLASRRSFVVAFVLPGNSAPDAMYVEQDSQAAAVMLAGYLQQLIQ